MRRCGGGYFLLRGKIVISARGAAMTDSDRTIALAEQALSQIKALHLSGDPQSFEIWYTYVAGTRPKLNVHINDILAQRQALTPADLDQIYRSEEHTSELQSRFGISYPV